MIVQVLMVIMHNINPILINLGFAQIRYYGLFYIIGLVVGYFFMKRFSKDFGLKLSADDIIDYVVYIGFGLFLGGRFFYFVFYQPWDLLSLELFKITKGGMSFHGGMIGAAVAGYVYSRKMKIPFMKLADITVLPVAIALALGRLGNFINGELVGRLWEGVICIDYSQSDYIANPVEGCRYPSQIFAFFKDIVLFGSLFYISKKKLPRGSIFWSFIALYGLLRFSVEFFRAPDPQLGFVLGWMTMGQVLSSIMILVAGIMIYRLNKHN